MFNVFEKVYTPDWHKPHKNHLKYVLDAPNVPHLKRSTVQTRIAGCTVEPGMWVSGQFLGEGEYDAYRILKKHGGTYPMKTAREIKTPWDTRNTPPAHMWVVILYAAFRNGFGTAQWNGAEWVVNTSGVGVPNAVIPSEKIWAWMYEEDIKKLLEQSAGITKVIAFPALTSNGQIGCT